MQNYISKFKISKTYTFFLFLFSYFFFISSAVHAQNISLGINPPTFHIMIRPEKSVTQVYKITNFKDPVVLSSQILPFAPLDETGGIKMIDCSKIEVASCESTNWFSFENSDLGLHNSFFLNSDKTQEIVLKLAIPADASEGDYYNVLLFSSQPPTFAGLTQSRSSIAVASPILITVSRDGIPNRDIKITALKIEKKYQLLPEITFTSNIFDTFDHIPVELKVTNTGTAYTQISGDLTLRGFPGITANFTINNQTVLANHTKNIFATPSAQIDAQASLILPRGIYLGKYLLTAEVENEEGKVEKKTVYFYALPLKAAGTISLIILLILVNLRLYRYIRNKTW